MNFSAPIAWPFTVEAEPGDTTVLVVGDTNVLGREDPASAFEGVRATFDAADAVIGQMEGMLTSPSDDPDRPDIPFKPWWRHSEPDVAHGFKRAGFGAVACASNVAYPPQACADTAAACRAAGLPMAGVGADEQEARRAAVFEVGGLRVGLLSYTSVFHPNVMPAGPKSPGCATIRAHTGWTPGRRALEMPGDPPEVATWVDPHAAERLRQDIAAARTRCDLVIVSCHWGVSSSAVTQDYQRQIAAVCASEGADLVFGHHPHVVHGAELVDGMPVFYSLGNFAFDGHKMAGRHLDGLMLRLLIRDGRIADIAIVPVRRGERNLVRIVDPAADEGADIMRNFGALCEAFAVALTDRGADATLRQAAE